MIVTLDPGPVLDVHITDFVHAKGTEPYARVTWTKKDGRRPTRYAPIRPDGTVRFVGVPADTPLELWATASPGRPVHANGLKAGSSRRAVTSIKGLTITGTVLGATGAINRTSVTAHVREHFKVGRTRLEPSGAFVISDLPPGTYTVRAQFTAGAISASPPVVVKAGARSVKLDLR